MTNNRWRRVSKEKQAICSYCHEHKPIVQSFGLLANIYHDQLFIDTEKTSANYFINYCPMCGRKLGEDE